MAFLEAVEKQEIEAAIVAAEKSTSGELIAVVAGDADDYLYVSMMWAAMFSLALPGLMALLQLHSLHEHAYAIQIASFFLFAIIFRWRPLLLLITPKALKYERAHRLAVEQFLSHNLHHTKERTGVLIFVAVAERYIEIIADKGINDKVGEEQWESIVDDFRSALHIGHTAKGFVTAIEACGALLAEAFPVRTDDENELPDQLVEI